MEEMLFQQNCKGLLNIVNLNMTSEGERIYLQCDPYDTGILDLDSYWKFLQVLDAKTAPLAQRVFENYIVNDWKLIMPKERFVKDFNALRPVKSLQLPTENYKTPSVYLDLSDACTPVAKENN